MDNVRKVYVHLEDRAFLLELGKNRRIGHLAFHIGECLLNYTGKDGEGWPSMDTLAKEAGTCRQSAQRAIKELENAGFLRVEYGENTKEGTPPNKYIINRGVQHSVAGGCNIYDMGGATPCCTKEDNKKEYIYMGTTTKAPAAKVIRTDTGFYVPPEIMAQWKAAFPAVDINNELKRAFEYREDTPKQGWRAWLKTVWLHNAQDRADKTGRQAHTGQQEPESWKDTICDKAEYNKSIIECCTFTDTTKRITE